MRLNKDIIYGFSNSLLLSRFDSPKPTPLFHKELWGYATRKDRFVAIAAPRGHAKSTAITHSFVLASVLFRVKSFVLIVSDTEGQATQFLGDIKKELLENEQLIEIFQIKKLVKETESTIIVAFQDGSEFRIDAKGSEQKVRGIKWRNRRPDLIIGDDLENDEIVLNEERRNKFRNWFFKALIPAGSDDCDVRIVGTILHMDSLLERLMPSLDDPETVEEDLKVWSRRKNPTWVAVKYRAHPDINDFSKLLWENKFNKARLLHLRQMYLDQGNPEGYNQEYLNNPIDESSAYFRRQDFLPLTPTKEPLDYYAGADFAISERDRRAYTAIVVVGVSAQGMLKVVDVRRFRGDSLKIVEELFSVHNRYHPELFGIESENIAKAIGPFLEQEMRKRGVYINTEPLSVSQDKRKRARSIQARMRAGTVEFDMEAEWYPACHTELIQFDRGRYSDQVDAFAHIGLMLDKVLEAKSFTQLEKEDEEQEYEDTFLMFGGSAGDGRSIYTGY